MNTTTILRDVPYGWRGWLRHPIRSFRRWREDRALIGRVFFDGQGRMRTITKYDGETATVVESFNVRPWDIVYVRDFKDGDNVRFTDTLD